MSSPNGSLTSPEYPNLYPEMSNITWTFDARPNELIMFKINDFQSELNVDYLCVYDNNTLIANYSGKLTHDGYLSTSNFLKLNFITDLSHQYKGFKLDYKIKRNGKYKLE